MHIVKL